MWIQVAGRFVGQDDLRAVNERPGECNALLLAARQLTRQRAQSIAQSKSPHQVRRRFVRSPFVPAAKQVGQRSILQNIQMWDQVKRLENESDQTSAQARGSIGFQLINPDHLIAITKLDRPRVGAIESRNEVH
jgi:hypothetical protein